MPTILKRKKGSFSNEMAILKYFTLLSRVGFVRVYVCIGVWYKNKGTSWLKKRRNDVSSFTTLLWPIFLLFLYSVKCMKHLILRFGGIVVEFEFIIFTTLFFIFYFFLRNNLCEINFIYSSSNTVKNFSCCTLYRFHAKCIDIGDIAFKSWKSIVLRFYLLTFWRTIHLETFLRTKVSDCMSILFMKMSKSIVYFKRYFSAVNIFSDLKIVKWILLC